VSATLINLFLAFQRIKKTQKKIENVCKLHGQVDYFETPAWEKLIQPLQNIFYLKIVG
jgi:hypothetical protein